MVNMSTGMESESGTGAAAALSFQPPPGMFFDELSRVRILEGEVFNQTQDLKEECTDFIGKMSEFHEIVSGFIVAMQDLAARVEKEKMKAIGSRNIVKSMAKKREAEQQQLQALLSEKRTQLERYRIQYESLLKAENEQNEFIQQFTMPQ
eukprot:Nk52_evm64s343 gene=Nk52_evmTU64s343